MTTKPTSVAITLVALGALAACGGGGSSPTSSTPTPAPVAAATITSTGAGALVLHPSLSPAWSVKLKVPIRIQETAGGTATWNYARLSLWRGGAELERGELGADVIAAPPSWADITARQDQTYSMVYGFNSSNFDRITLTLGFSDRKDGRAFQVDVPFTSFSDVTVSPQPLSQPGQSVHRLE